MIGKSLSEHLYNFCTSNQYNPKINIKSQIPSIGLSNMTFQYQVLSNPTQILPPSVWFTIDQNGCLTSIQKDIQKGRKSKQGFLVSTGKGNSLNRMLPFNNQEDIGLIQDHQNSLCVSYGVIKDTNEQFLKHIGSELRSCLVKKINIFQSEDIQTGQVGTLDEITKQIYRKYRIFIIFDSKSQPGKVISYHSCFYPNIRFIIEKIKTKDNIKYVSNEVFQQLKQGRLNNSFGYLSQDSRKRFLMIKKDDPEFSKQCFTGIWIAGSFPLKRTKKQYGKEDAIWQALFDFYTNDEVINKVSVTAENKGIICYFSTGKQNFKPELYIFSLDNKIVPKWSFLSKSECISDWMRPYQIKFDFVNTTIVEERQYSQFSNEANSEQLKLKNQNINRQNLQYTYKPQKNIVTNTKQTFRVKLDTDPKDLQIGKLKEELQFYRKKCIQLQAINKVLMQEKMMSHMMYQQPYFNQFPQMAPNQAYNYPRMQQNSQPYFSLSNSQVQVTHEREPVSPKINKIKSQKLLPTSPRRLNNQQFENRPEQHNYKSSYAFQQQEENILTFGSNKDEQNKHQNSQIKPFIKKKLSQQESNSLIRRQSETLKANSEVIKQIFVRPDAKNISFQDSFMEQRSNNQLQSESSSQDDGSVDENRQKANCRSDGEQEQHMSPEFKRFVSNGESGSSKKQVEIAIETRNVVGILRQQSEGSYDKHKHKSKQDEQIGKRIYKKYNMPNLSDDQDSENVKKRVAKKNKYVKQSESDDSDEGQIIKNIKNKYLYAK